MDVDVQVDLDLVVDIDGDGNGDLAAETLTRSMMHPADRQWVSGYVQVAVAVNVHDHDLGQVNVGDFVR